MVLRSVFVPPRVSVRATVTPATLSFKTGASSTSAPVPLARIVAPLVWVAAVVPKRKVRSELSPPPAYSRMPVRNCVLITMAVPAVPWPMELSWPKSASFITRSTLDWMSSCPVKVLFVAVSTRLPSPDLISPPVPLRTPLTRAPRNVPPLLPPTVMVRLALPRSIGFWKSTTASAEIWPRARVEPIVTKLPAPQVTCAPAPPRFTTRSTPNAAKPPPLVHCTCSSPVPRPRVKSPLAAVRPMRPVFPLMRRLLVPPVRPVPPGSALAWLSSSTPSFRRVCPV